MSTLFIITFSLVAGSLIMLVLNLIFYGNSYATAILAATTAINCYFLMTAYKVETKEALKKIFWKK
ncbi:hypothetical protein KP806_18240 [Paenibacillus sp. N4]|uniref:hypothetical protein n=1 Tax=Paenibacillus vietnamensis TaxID=2590547 RepID=UPI001CD0EC1B|nr:hypothetical protein [Paenibacillus vietnamensis]MCA0757004.1 hypothetical protein [Paenibacillus vietnamensis]